MRTRTNILLKNNNKKSVIFLFIRKFKKIPAGNFNREAIFIGQKEKIKMFIL